MPTRTALAPEVIQQASGQLPARRGILDRIADSVRGSWMGPGEPMRVVAPAGTPPRQFDYPTYFNTRTSPRSGEGISFAALRELAKEELVRGAIETVKIRATLPKYKVQPVEEGGSDKGADEITALLRRPDGRHTFRQWTKMLWEDFLVLSASACVADRNRGGKPIALQALDGATITPKIDETGREPLEGIAYQQIIRGVPAAEFTRQDLVYWTPDPRTDRVYGVGPVENLYLTINLLLRRSLSKLEYYTDGNLPHTVFALPESIKKDAIKDLQIWFDSLSEGHTREKSRARFIPGGQGFQMFQMKDQVLKDEADEWWARLVTWHFGLPPTSLVKMMNRATSEQIADTSGEEGDIPRSEEFAEFLTECVHRFWGYTHLRVVAEDVRKSDTLRQAQEEEILIRSGVLSPDEVRANRNLKDDGVKVGRFMMTGSGPMLLEDIALGLELEPDPDPNDPSPGLETDVEDDPDEDNDEDEDPEDDVVDDGKEGKEQRAAKAAGLRKRRRTVASLSRRQKRLRASALVAARETRKAERALAKTIGRALIATRKSILAQVAGELAKHAGPRLRKDEAKDRADAIAAALELSDLEVVMDPTAETLAALGENGLRTSVARVRVEAGEDPKGIEIDNEPVVRFANQRAAELVGKRVLADGSVVDNPNPKWAITDGTRELVRADITRALDEQWTREQLADALEENYAFSPSRARTIVRTEITRALESANVEGWKQSKVVDGKEWILGSEHDLDDECNDNANAGVIPIDQAFPSGDDAPPAHPNCVCAVIPSIVGA